MYQRPRALGRRLGGGCRSSAGNGGSSKAGSRSEAPRAMSFRLEEGNLDDWTSLGELDVGRGTKV